MALDSKVFKKSIHKHKYQLQIIGKLIDAISQNESSLSITRQY